MHKLTPATIERHLVEQTRVLLSRIDAASGRLSNASDVGALMMLVDQVTDNVSALTGDTIHDKAGENPVRVIEADYLFSRQVELRKEARAAIHAQMLKFTSAIRSTIDGPKDEDVPF